MQVKALNHVQVTIPRGFEDKAKDFYCGFLGLKEIEKPEELKRNGGFWLSLGELQIHVGIEDDVDRYNSKAHVAYEVTAIESWRQKLRDQQIEINEDLPIPGFERLSFRDPFGNKIEFLEAST